MLAAAVPLVSGAAIRWEGQIAVFDRQNPDSPCYRCLYASGDDAALTCSENGVIAPLVGIIGTCRALEAIKHVIGGGETLVGDVLLRRQIHGLAQAQTEQTPGLQTLRQN